MEDTALIFPFILTIGIFIFISIILWAIPVRLWIEAISASVQVGIGSLIGMRLRKVSPPAIVRPLITATKAGLDLDINELDQDAAAGTVNVDAGGTITVVAAQSGVTGTAGQVELDADGAASSIVVNDEVTTTGGAINILADDDAIFSADGDVTSAGGNVTVSGDANAGGSGTDGALTMADGAVIDAGSGTSG